MKITIVHGQNHKGSTYHIARMLAEKIGGDITEFFLPKDFGDYCVGCTSCFKISERKCPHYQQILPISNALSEADVIILASPVYVYHASGPMKNLLDHYGYRWMIHRPEPRMFSKQGVCISTAAGAGMRSTNKDMADSLFFWGVPKIYRYGKAVRATKWSEVSDKNRRKIEDSINRLAQTIRKSNGRVRPNLRTKAWFNVIRMIQMKFAFSPVDLKYWNEMGWTKKRRPWKK